MKELSQKEKYLLNINRIHMIGIGGSGMCPLAEILYKKGYQISGSEKGKRIKGSWYIRLQELKCEQSKDRKNNEKNSR